MTGQPIVTGPRIAEPESNSGMKHTEKELQNLVMEHLAEKLVTGRGRTKTVTVPQTKSLALDINHIRLFETHHAQFFKIAVSPDIVIPLKKIYLDTGVH